MATDGIQASGLIAGNGALTIAAHTLANHSDAPARYLLVITPAGFERSFLLSANTSTDIERSFREIALGRIHARQTVTVLVSETTLTIELDDGEPRLVRRTTTTAARTSKPTSPLSFLGPSVKHHLARRGQGSTVTRQGEPGSVARPDRSAGSSRQGRQRSR